MYIGLVSFSLTAACLAVHGWILGAIDDGYVAAILTLCAMVNAIALLGRRSTSRPRQT